MSHLNQNYGLFWEIAFFIDKIMNELQVSCKHSLVSLSFKPRDHFLYIRVYLIKQNSLIHHMLLKTPSHTPLLKKNMANFGDVHSMQVILIIWMGSPKKQLQLFNCSAVTAPECLLFKPCEPENTPNSQRLPGGLLKSQNTMGFINYSQSRCLFFCGVLKKMTKITTKNIFLWLTHQWLHQIAMHVVM